ncbi:MAG: N-acetylmuramoyl-L-alanine amidase [Lentisphaeria bacterium]|nr:N-acetylmuramoyl-L-alanine amidase [Lentisphaeria bacterium]
MTIFDRSRAIRILPAAVLLLTGPMLLSVRGAETRRVYRPTAAQLRLQEQNRQRQARIDAIRRQQAQQRRPQTPQAQTRPTAQTQTRQAKPVQTARPAAPAPAAKAPAKQVQIRYIVHQSVRYVLVPDVARYYGMQVLPAKNGITLKSPRDRIELKYDKRQAAVNGTVIYLTAAPLVKKKQVYLDEKDFQLVIDPVIRNAPLKKHPVKTILIDPGHGGKDEGAAGVSGLLEKNITLAIGYKLAVRLGRMGYRVFMTRIKDRTLTLQQRAGMCEKLKPDLFISVHCNAVASNPKANGIETYAMTPQGAASTADSKKGTQAGAGNAHDRNNYRLAYEVQKKLPAHTKAADRGVRHARFFVLRNATCPAILIETGFLPHASEGKLLNRKSYQEKLVTAIASGVSAYAGAVMPPKTAAQPKPAAKRTGK